MTPNPETRERHLSDSLCADLVLGLLEGFEREQALDHARTCDECEERLRAHAGACERAQADWTAHASTAPVPLRPKFALPAFFYLCIFALVVASRATLTSLLFPASAGLVALQFTRGPYKHAIVACLCALPIAGLSGTAGSAGGWQESLMAWFMLDFQQADRVVLCIRRTIHFVAYGTIALTFFRSAVDLPQTRRIATALVWVGSHAAFDELRQHLTPGRSGRVQDALIDLIGAATFLGIAWALARRRLV